ncbi:Rpn family recombination-promoting nuclease/putative transposase [Kyrpidia spormannii]|nr:Rpn family recombination-promoting nuclease/putative transposase [Kyrpidia spormannii]
MLVADVEILNPFLDKEALTDLAEIHCIELPKLREQSSGLEQWLVRWMLFFTAMGDRAIRKVLTTLEFLSQDEEARRLYEERMKGLQTYLADMEGARQEGREEGRKEGREEGDREARKELARALLDMGDDSEKVVQVTKLSKEEVEVIRRAMGPDQ